MMVMKKAGKLIDRASSPSSALPTSAIVFLIFLLWHWVGAKVQDWEEAEAYAQ